MEKAKDILDMYHEPCLVVHKTANVLASFLKGMHQKVKAAV
ncbi:MAG: hypothetical protein ACTS8R_03930 [Arsenophonus sp. NC-QC1-MAG3]